jgi:membrane associated rhomboid family serine protease
VDDEPLRCYRHPDRETRVSCSECGRGVCPDCMVFAPVGIRCLDHASQGSGTAKPALQRRARTARGGLLSQDGAVTRILIGLNVAVFLVNLLQGASLGRNGGALYTDWFLIAQAQLVETGQLIGVAEGEWWRLLTAAFLHGSIIHLALNMLFLWFIGTPVEIAIGRWRFIGVYLATALSGSAGALLFAPDVPTVGASGALFGILGCAVVLEQQGMHVLGGSALGIVILNFAITLFVPGISIGGHVGGFVGGVVCGFALTRFGRGHAAYGRLGPVGVGAIVGVGVASVLVAYFKVRGYA